jgi:hypothetical protein
MQLLGVFIIAWGVLSDITFLTFVGLLVFSGAAIVGLWWWVKALFL